MIEATLVTVSHEAIKEFQRARDEKAEALAAINAVKKHPTVSDLRLCARYSRACNSYWEACRKLAESVAKKEEQEETES